MMRLDFKDPVYSIQDDPRASEWSSTLPESISAAELGRLLPIRLPLLQVVVGCDLADPEDLTTLDVLFLQPSPIDVYVVPTARSANEASRLLTDCFGTIYEGTDDRERFKDFLKAMADFSRIRTNGPYSTVTLEQAKLACRIFTKDLSEVERMIVRLEGNVYETVSVSLLAQKYEISPGTVYVNGVRIDNATIEKVFPQLVESQRSMFVPASSNEEL